MGARIVNMVFVADVAQRKSAASQAGGVGWSLYSFEWFDAAVAK